MFLRPKFGIIHTCQPSSPYLPQILTAPDAYRMNPAVNAVVRTVVEADVGSALWAVGKEAFRPLTCDA